MGLLSKITDIVAGVVTAPWKWTGDIVEKVGDWTGINELRDFGGDTHKFFNDPIVRMLLSTAAMVVAGNYAAPYLSASLANAGLVTPASQAAAASSYGVGLMDSAASAVGGIPAAASAGVAPAGLMAAAGTAGAYAPMYGVGLVDRAASMPGGIKAAVEAGIAPQSLITAAEGASLGSSTALDALRKLNKIRKYGQAAYDITEAAMGGGERPSWDTINLLPLSWASPYVAQKIGAMGTLESNPYGLSTDEEKSSIDDSFLAKRDRIPLPYLADYADYIA